jgi:hypothetical protein
MRIISRTSRVHPGDCAPERKKRHPHSSAKTPGTGVSNRPPPETWGCGTHFSMSARRSWTTTRTTLRTSIHTKPFLYRPLRGTDKGAEVSLGTHNAVSALQQTWLASTGGSRPYLGTSHNSEQHLFVVSAYQADLNAAQGVLYAVSPARPIPQTEMRRGSFSSRFSQDRVSCCF